MPIDDGQIRMKPKVYLIGAGPGDPELLTVKAHRILRQADVVLHDELVSRGILDLVRPSARVQNIGKRCGRQSIRQEEIHSRMVSCAREGLTVVRLKGGDPLVFGRANEEIAALRACGVEFEIIPGVTAALAAAASARISLTDRRLASRVTFLTNHWCAGKAAPDMTHEASSGATVVIYMPGGDNALLSRAQIHLKRAEADRPTRWLFAVHLHPVSHAALGPQADPPLDFLKARVAADPIEVRPNFDENHLGVAIFVSLLKSSDCEVLLSKPVINDA